MQGFEIGDRVCIAGHWEFPDGTTGTIAAPEPFQLGLAAPGEWCDYRRTVAGRKGPIVFYYVRFDRPTHDGPVDGPVRDDGLLPSAIGLALDPDRRAWHDGIAYARSSASWRRGRVVLWRLECRKVAVDGLWVLDNREFVPLDDWRARAGNASNA